VVPFQRGAPSTAKQVGQIPANYTQGSGTIVSGTNANKATEAALAAYSGGIVDRVVKLSNGEYEVHNIGVDWPHHIFVNRDFKVVGADKLYRGPRSPHAYSALKVCRWPCATRRCSTMFPRLSGCWPSR